MAVTQRAYRVLEWAEIETAAVFPSLLECEGKFCWWFDGLVVGPSHLLLAKKTSQHVLYTCFTSSVWFCKLLRQEPRAILVYKGHTWISSEWESRRRKSDRPNRNWAWFPICVVFLLYRLGLMCPILYIYAQYYITYNFIDVWLTYCTISAKFIYIYICTIYNYVCIYDCQTICVRCIFVLILHL